MLERLNDEERDDLSGKLDNIVTKSQEHPDAQLIEKFLEYARHNVILADLDISFAGKTNEGVPLYYFLIGHGYGGLLLDGYELNDFYKRFNEAQRIALQEWFENYPQTTLQGTYDGPWLSSDQYKALMKELIECDSKSKNSIPPLVENKYHAGMTKEQCIEQFIEDAPHNRYEWDLHYLPEGGVMFYFSRESQFFFTIEEYEDLCKRIKDAEKKYFASLNQR
jgi:hypothetical protein